MMGMTQSRWPGTSNFNSFLSLGGHSAMLVLAGHPAPVNASHRHASFPTSSPASAPLSFQSSCLPTITLSREWVGWLSWAFAQSARIEWLVGQSVGLVCQASRQWQKFGWGLARSNSVAKWDEWQKIRSLRDEVREVAKWDEWRKILSVPGGAREFFSYKKF